MFTASRLKYLYLSYLSKPASDRIIYRTIGKRKVRRILEIGIGRPSRSLRLINLATRLAPGQQVRYAAIDLFEARAAADAPGMPLKEAHRLFKSTTAQIQLIPGDPASALARWANSLVNVDLVFISSDYDEQTIGGAWFYLPRMLHPASAVLVESLAADAAERSIVVVPPDEIARRAAACRGRRAA